MSEPLRVDGDLEEQTLEETGRRLKALPALHQEFLNRLAWCYCRAVAETEEERLLEAALHAACEARGVLALNIVSLARRTEPLAPMKRRTQ